MIATLRSMLVRRFINWIIEFTREQKFRFGSRILKFEAFVFHNAIFNLGEERNLVLKCGMKQKIHTCNVFEISPRSFHQFFDD